MRMMIYAAAALAVSGCATTQGAADQQAAGGASITIAVGPCFGFCPVYEVSIAPSGRVEFAGQRHTEVLGRREREAGEGIYRQVASDLARFRPEGNEPVKVECSAAVTDTPSYTITWTMSSGTKAVATHQAGCPSGPGHDLDAVLKGMPQRLGIDGWSKQITRPGTSRG